MENCNQTKLTRAEAANLIGWDTWECGACRCYHAVNNPKAASLLDRCAALEKDVALGLEIQHNLERRLAAESGLLDEAILFLHTIGRGLLPWATGQDMMSNFHDKLISVRAAAAKGDKESK